MTEEEKAAQKARPVATNPIPGTPWYASHIRCTPTSSLLTDRGGKKIIKSIFLFIQSGVWYGRVTTVFSSTTRPHGCRCGTGPKSWSADPTWTNTSRSRHTREAWRTARRRVSRTKADFFLI